MADSSGRARALSRRQLGASAVTGVAALASWRLLSGDAEDDEEEEDDEDAYRLVDAETDVVVAVEGGFVKGAEVEMRATRDEEPVADADVGIEGRTVGQTDADGRASVQVPLADAIEVSLTRRDDVLFDESVTTERPANSDDHWFGWFDTAQHQFPVESFQYNPRRRDGRTSAMAGLFAPYAEFDCERGEFLPYLFEEWWHEDGRMVASMREDVTWETGEPVDADAIVFQWELLLDEDEKWGFVTDVAATGDYEVAFHYEPGTNRGVVEHAVLHERADLPRTDWESVRDDDAVSLGERALETPTASGPLTLHRRTEDYHEYAVRNLLESVPDHPAGDHFNWNGYRMGYREDQSRIGRAVRQRELDGVHDLSASYYNLERYPDAVETVTVPEAFGLGLWFDHGSEPWDDRAVRQAFACSIDTAWVVESVRSRQFRPHTVQTGLTDTARDQWFDESDLAEFDRYERDADRAERLLADAGLEFGDVQPELVVPERWSGWLGLVDGIANELRRVGWDVDLVRVGSEYWSRRRDGEFDVVAAPYVDAVEHHHPYFGFRHQLAGEAGTPADWSNYVGAEGEAAAPVVDVDGESVDLRATLQNLARTNDSDEQSAAVETLARVVNRDLPYVHVTQRYRQLAIDREKWSLPEGSRHLQTRRPLWWLPLVEADLAGHGF